MAIVEIGFIAAATTTGSPLVMPPSKPPKRLLERTNSPSGSESRISSCTSLERRLATPKPSPISTPFMAFIDMTAWASLASSLSRQST